jgi:hypothetical protein
METIFLLLLMLLAAFLWMRGSEWAAGFCCALLVATRVDAIAWVGTLFLAFILAKRVFPWRATVAFGTSIAIWIAVAIYAWGTFIPVTAKVKMLAYDLNGSFAVRLLSVFEAFFRFGNRTVLIEVILVFFAFGLWIIYKRRSIAGGAMIFYIIGSAVAFAIARIPIFPWYVFPVNLAMIFVATLESSWLLSEVKAPYTATLIIFSLFFGIWLLRDYKDSWKVLQYPANLKIGRWLQDHAKPNSTVFTEPAGEIGFYCNCRLRDSIGLVNPKILKYWIRPGGRKRWFSTAMRESKADYVVLRKQEYKTGILFSSDHTPLFATESDKQWFHESYRQVFSADPSVLSSTQDAFLIFQRE